MSNISYHISKSSIEDILAHLKSCSFDFKPRLETYVDIDSYSNKLISRAIRFEAFVESKLVGLIAIYVNSNEKLAFITSVSVESEYQGHGIASELLKKAKEYAKGKSIEKINLEVFPENLKAINFYKNHGFKTDECTLTKINMSHNLKRDYNQEFRDTQDHKYAYNFDFDVMHHYMIKSFEPFFKGNDVLELGSFKGDFTRRLLPYFSDITCVEASDEAVELARSEFKNVTFYNSLFENTNLPRKYNNIILTHVLEHIDDPVGLLEKIGSEWLSENGNLFLVCPNSNAPSRQIAVKMGLISHNSAITKSEMEHGHRITYSLDTLERDAKIAGLDVIHRSGIFFKALANFQWDRLLDTDIISKEYLEGCFQLGQQYPDLCSSIFLICKRKK